MDLLNERQLSFVDHYLKTGNATQSAILAGYSQKTANTIGSQLLRHKLISKRIQAATQAMNLESIANAQELQERLTAIIRSAEEKTQDRTRAIELLAKLQGLMIDRAETVQTVDMEALKNLSINELLDLRKTLSSKERAS